MQNKFITKKNLFYIAMFLFCMPTILQLSMLIEIQIWRSILIYLRYASFALAFLLIAWNLLETGEWKTIIWCMGILCLVGISSIISGDRTLLGCVMLVMASKGIDFDGIIRFSLLTMAGSFSFVIILCVMGFLPDMMFKRQDIPIRHALGFNYPSTVMTCLFSMLVMFLWIRRLYISVAGFVFIELVNYLFFRLTDSRIGFLMIAALTLCVFLWNRSVLRQIALKIAERYQTILKVVSDWFAVWMVIMTGVMVLLFPTSLGQLLDRLLTKRVYYIISGVQNYGIHLLGNRIDWIGFGGSYDTDSLLNTYNYVDNSYIWLLLNFGLLAFVLVLVMTIYLNKRVRRDYQNGEILLILCFLAYCFAEPMLINIYVNPFLFLTAPFLCGEFLRVEYKKNE